ncbi:uncharacterized protein LOC124649058 [Lolium rigidum]|uniref:uncharacterized protein LOC124649058 n=1 Tax=Lolium rigidum TaxID=89674 RepID=UPI001F5C1C69|nr:uncharacterized protein LOC124649058 [Lolium rigidum]
MHADWPRLQGRLFSELSACTLLVCCSGHCKTCSLTGLLFKEGRQSGMNLRWWQRWPSLPLHVLVWKPGSIRGGCLMHESGLEADKSLFMKPKIECWGCIGLQTGMNLR